MMGARSTGSVLFATMFPQTVVSMMSLTPPVMAEHVVAQLGLPPEATGLYTGLIYCFVLLTNTLSSPLMGRFGPLRLSFGCVVVAGLGLALFGSGSTAGALVATVLIGLGYGPLTPASSQVLAGQSASKAFAFIVSIRQTSVPLGGVLAGLVVPHFILVGGWQLTCVILGLGIGCLGGAIGLSLPAVRREEMLREPAAGRGLLGPLRFILRTPGLLTLSGASMIFGALQLILSSFLVLYLVAFVGYDLVAAGVLLGCSQVSGVLGRIGWGYIADRIRSSRRLLAFIALGMTFACLATATLASKGPSLLALPVVIVFGATASGWNGVYLAEVMRETDRADVGLATSGTLMFTYAGVVLGPPLFGGAAALMGFPGAYAVMAGVCLLGAFLALQEPKRGRA